MADALTIRLRERATSATFGHQLLNEAADRIEAQERAIAQARSLWAVEVARVAARDAVIAEALGDLSTPLDAEAVLDNHAGRALHKASQADAALRTLSRVPQVADPSQVIAACGSSDPEGENHVG